MKYLNSVCAGLMHGVVGSVEDLLCSGATHASMVVLLSNRQIEMEEGYHTDGMSIRTTLLLRSECQKMDLPEPYIVTELFNSANTVFIDSTSWGGSNAKTKSHYTLSPVFSEGKIYTSALNDTLLGMSYYVPRMAECLVAMIDGPSKLRHFEVPLEFVGKTYIEIVKYLQAHETIAVAVVSKGLAVGVEQRSEIGSIAVGGREGAARTTPIISMSLAAATGWPVFGWTGKQSAWSAAVEPAARPFIALRETRTKREEISAENVVNK